MSGPSPILSSNRSRALVNMAFQLPRIHEHRGKLYVIVGRANPDTNVVASYLRHSVFPYVFSGSKTISRTETAGLKEARKTRIERSPAMTF